MVNHFATWNSCVHTLVLSELGAGKGGGTALKTTSGIGSY